MQLEILLNWWLKGSNDCSCALKITWRANCHLAIKNLVELKVSRESAWFTGELTSREGCLLVSRAQHYWGIFLLPSARPHHHHTPRRSAVTANTVLLYEATAPTDKLLNFSNEHFLFSFLYSLQNWITCLLFLFRHTETSLTVWQAPYQEGLCAGLRRATHTLLCMDTKVFPSSALLLFTMDWHNSGIHHYPCKVTTYGHSTLVFVGYFLSNLDTFFSQFFYVLWGPLFFSLSRIQHNT